MTVKERRLLLQSQQPAKIESKIAGFSMGQPPKELKEVVVKEENPKIDETTSTITSIVFIRDASMLDDNNEIDQREAFQHHNYLNVKSLVKKRELLADEASSPTARAALRMKPKITQQNFVY